MPAANRLLTTCLSISWSLPGCPNGKPILVLTDSIGKALPSRPQWQHVLLSGKSFPEATSGIHDRSIRVGGRRVIVIHLGTNGLCYNTWRGKMTPETVLYELICQVELLFRAVRTFNSTAFIVFSAVLPRRCDWENTKKVVLDFNTKLKAFCKRKNCGFMPTYSSFSVSRGPEKGNPLPGLWAIRDGGLHLNLPGRHLFTERFKSALHPRQLGVMARSVGFPHWR